MGTYIFQNCTALPVSSLESTSDNVEVAGPNREHIANAFKKATPNAYSLYGEEELRLASTSVYNLNLEQFLKLTNSGRYVLSVYQKERLLTRKARNILVDLLVNGVMTECSGLVFIYR